MTARATISILVETDAEVDADYTDDGEPEVRSLRIAGVELWPLMRERMEFAAVREQIDERLDDWAADNLAEVTADARSAA